MELEFFRIEIDSEGCKIVGFILVELNDYCLLLLFINFEMEWFYCIVIWMEGENLFLGDSIIICKL